MGKRGNDNRLSFTDSLIIGVARLNCKECYSD